MDLVIVKENKAVTTSLKVAESFGKRHRDVMRNISNLTAQNCAVGKMFAKSTYLNKHNHNMSYRDKAGHWHYYTSAVKLLEANALEIKDYEENHIEEDQL